MDLRNERYGSNSNLRKVGVPSRDQQFGHYSDVNRSRDNYHSFNQKRQDSTSSPYSHPLRSPSYEEALRIEQRHEDLKRQIALKEKQLADMTGERETINALRNKLGLKDLNPDESRLSFDQSKGNLGYQSSKRGNLLSSSVSPDHSLPSMVGLKSTTYGRNISQERTGIRNRVNFKDEPSSREDQLQSKYASQQLQFHPTRIPAVVRRVQPTSNNSSTSPLRQKSSGRGESGLNFMPPEPRHYEMLNRSQNSNNRSSSSPMRRRAPTIIEEAGESSENQNDTYVSMQRVQPMTSSGRPMMTSIPLNAREKLYRERIEAMTLDNQSLQRRLNQVSSELDRIQRENEAIVRQIEMVGGDVERFRQLINNKDDVDAQNNIMQQDLQRMKNANLDLNQHLRDEENRTQDATNKLGLASANVKSIEIDYDSLNHDFRQKIQRFDAISREKAMTVQRLSSVNVEIDRLAREELSNNHENIDLDANVARLQQERHSLLEKIERITRKYDSTVRDLSYGKRNMDRDNSWHTKLIVTKNMHVALELMTRRRKQIIFNELCNYSVFDGQCHQKLRNLANTLEKVGLFKQMVSLHQWYDKALKPRATILQNEDLTMLANCQKLTDKVFYAWRHYVHKKQEVYHFKQNSIEKIWYRLVTDSRKEMKRAFDKWKQKRIFERHTLGVVRRVVKNRNLRRMERAMMIWRRFSQELEYHCRVRLLHKDFTRKAFMSHAFSQLRISIRIEKQQRQRMLNQFFKAWQDNIMYNRHLMQANMVAIAFRNKNTEFTKRACFQALRNYTEQSKYTLLRHAVQQDMDVVIANTAKFNKEQQQQLLTKNQLRAGNITRDILGKRLYSYFHKWLAETRHYSTTMNDKFKIRIIKVYLRLMNSFFSHWKKNIFDKERLKKMKQVMDLQMQCEQMTNETLEQERGLKQRAEGNKSFQRRVVEKTFKRCIKIRLQQAMDRWKDKCIDRDNKQGRAEFVFTRLRKRLLQQAFNKYLWFLRKSQQRSKNERRADHIQETLKMREMRKIFNALCYYTQWRRRVKRVWHKVLYRFDYFQKQRAIKRWTDNAHETHEKRLKQRQHEMTNILAEQNDFLQSFQINTHGQQNVIMTQEKNLRRKGYRQIGNMFLRLYSDQTSKKFNIWKQKVLLQKQKETIMRRSVEHFQRRYLEQVQRVFLKFLSDERRKERIEQINATKFESTQIEFNIQQNRKKQEAVRSLKQNQVGETNCQSAETERKVLHTMECMARRNLNWVYRSKKRMIFEMWRTVCKEEKAFAYAVKNVMMKSLLQEGFTRIKYQARDIDFTQKVHRMLIRFSLKGGHINMSDSLTKWKRFAFNKVDSQTANITQDLMKAKADFQSFRDATQEKNFERVTAFFIEKNQANIFRAWRNVIKHFKLVKSKTKEFRTRRNKLQRIWALKLWSMRTEKTKSSRHANEFLIKKFQNMYLKAAFKELKLHYNRTRSLTASLHHFETAMRTKIYGDAFKALQAFSQRKNATKINRNTTGALQTKRILNNIYRRVLSKWFNRYKDNCSSGSESNATFKAIYGKYGNRRLRDAFYWWKKKNSLCELKQELHETGPVRAEHWLAEREIENLKDFMRDQHYTELEINKVFDDVDKTNQNRMMKHMIRMKYKLDPNKRLLPIVMDRWKGFVAIRKNVKHQFRFLGNFKENQKAEMQLAFNKWRRGSDKLEQELWRLDYKTLEQIALKTTQELKECSDQISENQSINNHLVLQRDEFLNYYIKGQILAMALIRDRNEFAKMQSISRWLLNYRKRYLQNLRENIRDDEYLLANLEEREQYLDKHNIELVEENAEMEQFKQDGEIIKRNKHRLEQDVAKLKEQMELLEEELKKLQEIKFETQAELNDELEKIKENQARGYTNQLTQNHKKAQLKKQPNASIDIIQNEEETAEERAMRQKMEQLQNLSRVGPALR